MRFFVLQSALMLLGVASWSIDGIELAREWVAPDGRMNLQSQMPGMPTAISLWPAAVPAQVPDALAEVTLHATHWADPCVERMGIAAMPEPDGDYRITIERGAGCAQDFAERRFRGFRICFDTPPGEKVDPATTGCRLIIRPDGVWISRDGRRWTLL